MANQEHVMLLKQGVEVWNHWRQEDRRIPLDLTRAHLRGANLNKANLSAPSDLSGADLIGVNLNKAILMGAHFSGADLWSASLVKSDLRGTNLSGADLREADLSGADLSRANLSHATVVGTNLTNATLKECRIYGISVGDVQLDGADQRHLIITRHDQPTITVDHFKVAQFIYLLLNNAEIRNVIDTNTSKVVLILGRFSPSAQSGTPCTAGRAAPARLPASPL